VPQDLDALVELPGIGRKTANVVLGTAFAIATGVVVDTHVTRVSRRLGLSAQKDPVKIEQDLMQLFAESEWVALSHRMIQLGRQVCTARKPRCDACPLESFCPRIGVEP
jgi:endonuclease-3